MTAKEVAIYSFGYSLGSIVSIALMSMNTAWIPWFFEEKKKGNVNLINKYKERFFSDKYLIEFLKSVVEKYSKEYLLEKN